MHSQIFNERLINRYDTALPRYTSYPTAPRFHSGVGERAYRQDAADSNADPIPRPLSLYVHIPFCSTVCFYCACNKIITGNRAHADTYLRTLSREIEIHGALFDADRQVWQMHWGGGTPTFFSDPLMRRLMDVLRAHFHFAEDAELSIELDPREITPDGVASLRELGFNRMSIGVQDVDPRVQQAVNRIQPLEKTVEILHAAREHGFGSINLDLIYGLPLQTPESFARTLDEVVAMRPDRLSVFNYAHLPHRFKTQRQINQTELPSARDKLAILRATIEHLMDAGYVYIGMDHFALPGDELAVAQENGTLHRNFQGYSTHGNCDLVGLGVSAISDIGGNFFQNHVRLDAYAAAIARGRPATARGYQCNHDDRLRRAVIHGLICHFELDTRPLARRFGISFARYFAAELNELQGMARDGLVEIAPNVIRVRPAGRLLIRNICEVFDRYSRRDTTTAFSRAI